MGLLLGLVAAVGWGTADFIARYTTRSIGTYRTLGFMQVFGLVGLSIYLFASGTLGPLLAGTTWQLWLWVALEVVLNIVSSLALYYAFEVGVLMIVSPIAASYAAITAALAVLSGEAITLPHAFAMLIVIVGVIFAATSFAPARKVQATSLLPRRKRKVPPGILAALLASLGYGVSLWVLGFHVVPTLGGIVPVWIIRLTTPCMLALFAPLARQSFQIPTGRVWWYLAGVGIFDTVAFVANALGVLHGQVSIVNVLSSLYSAVTVLLAAIFLRERLQWSQWLGIGIILIGVALINF